MLRAYLDGNDRHARKKMHVASLFGRAGVQLRVAGNQSQHGPSAGARFHIPHGRANAMLLPYIIEYNSYINKHSRSRKDYPKQVEKYCTIARILGLQNFNTITTVRALVAWVQFMLKEMDILSAFLRLESAPGRRTLRQFLIWQTLHLQMPVHRRDPRVPTKDDIMEIYETLGLNRINDVNRDLRQNAGVILLQR